MRVPVRALLAGVALLLTGGGETEVAPSGPRVVLWAWERPEDLRFVRDPNVGVAFLAATLRLQRNSVSAAPRRQPLRVSEQVPVTAVVRIEADASALLDEAQRSEVIRYALEASRAPRVQVLQIDFDATRSQRDGYVALLRELRIALPEQVGLSMTALASWCVFDRWVDQADLPVDEVVPMVFAMGRGGPDLRSRLAADGDFRERRCRRAVGYATWESPPTLPANRRVYWFHDAPWTPDAVRYATSRSER